MKFEIDEMVDVTFKNEHRAGTIACAKNGGYMVRIELDWTAKGVAWVWFTDWFDAKDVVTQKHKRI